MKRRISLILTLAMLFTMLPRLQAQAVDAQAKMSARDASVFVDGVYVLALAAEGTASEYDDGSVRRVLDMAMPDSRESLLQLNHYTGEASQQFIIRQYSKNTEYYTIQSVNNQGYLGYNGMDGKKATVKRYGQLDNNAAEYLWKPVANPDGSWSFAPMHAFTADQTVWNLRLGVTDTQRGSAGTTAALVATDSDDAMQRWFLQPCNILEDSQQTTFQIVVSQEFSGKSYATDNIGGITRGAWDGLSANISVSSSDSKSQKFLFERVEPAALQTYQTSADYRNAVEQSGGGYYSVREVSNSEYLSVGENGKLVLQKELTDAGVWMVFPNWSQNNQSEKAIADTYSLVSYMDGRYYSVSTEMTDADFGVKDTAQMLQTRQYAYDEAYPYRQYWKLNAGERNPYSVTDGGTGLQKGSFGTSYLSLPIRILDFNSDNMLFEYDSYWPSGWPALGIDADNWLGGTNDAFSLGDRDLVKDANQIFSVSSADLSSYGYLDGYSLTGTQTGGNLGLVEHSLSDELPVYRQEVVEYLAETLRTKLAIPYRNSDGQINNTYLSGEADGERYGYGADGQARDLAQWLRDTITKDEGTFVLGDYDSTSENGANLIAAWDAASKNIHTCMDAAYFMLNSLFVSGSYNYDQSEYQYLKLGQTVTEDGRECFVFDSALGDENYNSSVVYGARAIYNSAAATRPLYHGNAKYPFLPITSKNNESGMTRYESPMYYPLRNLEQYGETCYCRNYSYALSCNSDFVYREADDLFFDFAGNDDAYLFINGELVMDMGGTHSAAEASIKLNDYVKAARNNVAAAEEKGEQPSARDKALALEDGQTCSFDFYYMQRMGTEANLRIATNIQVMDTQDGKHLDGDGDGLCDHCGRIMGAYLLSRSLTLSGNIGVNYYMELSDEILSDTDNTYYMEFTVDGRTTQVALDRENYQQVDGQKYYRFTCETTSTEMTDTITAHFCKRGADESVLRSTMDYSFSVLEYANYVIQHSEDKGGSYSPSLVDLVKAILNYGGHAQVYFGHAGENGYANAGLDFPMEDPETDAKYDRKVEGSVTGLCYYGSSLILKSETSVRFYFTLEEGCDICDYTFKLAGKDGELSAKQWNGRYYVEAANIGASHLADMFTVTVTRKDSNETEKLSVTYGPMTYVLNALSNSTASTELQNVAKALYNYYRCYCIWQNGN